MAQQEKACKRLRQIPFLWFQRNTGVFKVSHASIKMLNKIMQEKAGVKNSKAEFQERSRKELIVSYCSMPGVWQQF